MSNTIKRYRLAQPMTTEEYAEGFLVTFPDHEADCQCRIAEAVQKERERCRREEVKPLLRAAQRVLAADGNIHPEAESRALADLRRAATSVQKIQEENPTNG
jgi:hypothetical protein